MSRDRHHRRHLRHDRQWERHHHFHVAKRLPQRMSTKYQKYRHEQERHRHCQLVRMLNERCNVEFTKIIYN